VGIMTMRRGTVGLTLVSALLGIGGIVIACGPATAWPPTVQSGQGGGGGGASSPSYPDGSTPDTGTGDDTGVSGDSGVYSCNIPKDNECQLSTRAITCANTPNTGCSTTNLVGCCTITAAGITTESCYYTTSAAQAAQSTCTSTATGGTWTANQNPL
jgi:hypothetical protein